MRLFSYFAAISIFIPVLALALDDVRTIRDIDDNLNRLPQEAPKLMKLSDARFEVVPEKMATAITNALETEKIPPAKRPLVTKEISTFVESNKSKVFDFTSAELAQSIFTDLISDGRQPGKAITLTPVSYMKLGDFNDGRVVANWFLNNGRPLDALDVRVLRLKGLAHAAAAYAANPVNVANEMPVTLKIRTSAGDLSVTLLVEISNYGAFERQVVSFLFGTQNIILMSELNQKWSDEEVQGVIAHEVQHLYDFKFESFLNSEEFEATEAKYLALSFKEMKGQFQRDLSEFKNTKESAKFYADVTELVQDQKPKLTAEAKTKLVEQTMDAEFWRYLDLNFIYFGKLKEVRGFHAFAQFLAKDKKFTRDQVSEADCNVGMEPTVQKLKNGKVLSLRLPNYPVHQALITSVYGVERAPVHPVYECYLALEKRKFSLKEIAPLVNLVVERAGSTKNVRDFLDQLRLRAENETKETLARWITSTFR